MAALSLEARASNMLAMAARWIRDTPSLRHDAAVALAERCEALAGELHQARAAAPDGPGASKRGGGCGCSPSRVTP